MADLRTKEKHRHEHETNTKHPYLHHKPSSGNSNPSTMNTNFCTTNASSSTAKHNPETRGLNDMISTLSKMLADINGLLAIHDTPIQRQYFGPYHGKIKKGLATCSDGILDLLNTVRMAPGCKNGHPSNKHGWRADALWKQIQLVNFMIDAAVERNDDDVKHYEGMMEDVFRQLKGRFTPPKSKH